VPRSRWNPQFNTDALPEPLAGAGVGYRHIRALGGLRHHPKGAAASRNTLWRAEPFRNYADYAASDAFRVGLDELKALADEHCCAIMCAEAVWWRCHRRIVADHLLARRVPVAHILSERPATPATLTSFAVVTRGRVHYPRREPARGSRSRDRSVTETAGAAGRRGCSQHTARPPLDARAKHG
jgi:uncharacterized protein (DUF488 family)